MQRTLGIDGARTCGGPTSEQLQAEATITKHPTPPVFKYEALEPDAIRLLKWCTGSKAVDPHFELVTSRYLPHTQKYDVPYNALSYCWGHATHPKNLWSALQSIVYPEKLEMRRSGLLWIDAICINQQDIEERSSQVQQMWRIFNNATVIAWLGDSNEQVYASYFQCISQCDWPPKLRTSMEPAMKDILARQYFSRAWIAPELTQASRVDFLCGNRAHWSHEALSSLADQLAKESLGTNEVRSANLIRSAALGNRFEEEGNDAGSIFNRVFEAFYEAGCTDRRDRIFAMLQDPRIRRLSLSLKPDYSLSENDLWLAVMKQYFSFLNCHSWDKHAERTMPFERMLSKALDVDHATEEFGRWLEPKIELTFRVGEAKAIRVAVLEAGGMILLPGGVRLSTLLAGAT